MTGAEPRYLAVAGSCAVMHNLIMIVGNLLGVHYLSSSVVSFVLVALTGYVLHAHFTFRTSPSARSLLRYALAMAGNYPFGLNRAAVRPLRSAGDVGGTWRRRWRPAS